MRRLFIASMMTFGAFMLTGPAVAQNIPPVVEPDEETTILGTSEFVSPVWMAVISDAEGNRFLVESGNPVFRRNDPRPFGVVGRVGPGGISVSPTQGRKVVRVHPGRSLPGARDLVFREAVLVKTLEYRHRVVGHARPKVLDGELYLVEVRGDRAIVQRDKDAPPSRTEVMLERLAAIRIVETAPRVWEVSARDAQMAMESGEAIIANTLTDSRVDFSRDLGVSLEVRTPIVAGRFQKTGFLITTPNLAARAGLQVGDRILRVNDVPIDGFGSLIQVYRKIRNDASVGAISLLIERDEKPLSLTYRIR